MMRFLRTILPGAAALGSLLIAAAATGEPRSLYPQPVSSPDRVMSANVSWDDAGFMGRIAVKVYDSAGRQMHEIALPEIDPKPADLIWLDNVWIAVESILGEGGSGYFYVHAPTGQGCLLEMVESNPEGEWAFSICVDDGVSSASVPNASDGRKCLFPVLLPDLPTTTGDFFRPDFPPRLLNAAAAFSEFRRQAGFRKIELLAGPDIREGVGAVALLSFDDAPELVYFPVATTCPLEMFSRVRRKCLNDASLQALASLEPTELDVRWGDRSKDAYVIRAVTGRAQDRPATTTLMRGRFPGVHDEPPAPPRRPQRPRCRPFGWKPPPTPPAPAASNPRFGPPGTELSHPPPKVHAHSVCRPPEDVRFPELGSVEISPASAAPAPSEKPQIRFFLLIFAPAP